MKKALVLALSSSLLIACGGGGGGSVPSTGGGGSTTSDASMGGIWEGTVTETGGTQYTLKAAIDENGEAAWYVSDGEMSI
ncbi:hypothetical protein ACFOEK_12085 [Litoribrevibacter euphylliae]|uniref:Uncharacterized protein n=1 Tax=Litoribrevibacter euphylliae TaxID=1834034 RepID=A0ABV7HD12_9GAMM